jgi:sporulation protein YlmC with PRC-barrel domain
MHQRNLEGDRRGKELLGMTVYSVQEGKRLGEITSLLVQRENSSVAAVRIGSQLALGPAIAYADLRLVGIDIILVESEAVLRRELSAEEVRLLDDGVPGRPVFTTSGVRVGTVSGFWVHTDTGQCTAYRVRPDTGLLSRLARVVRSDSMNIPVEQIHSLGADALVVSDAVVAVSEEVPTAHA